MLRLVGGIFCLSALGVGWLAYGRLAAGALLWQETWTSLAALVIYCGACGLGALAWNGKAGGLSGALFRGPVGPLLTATGTAALFLAWLVLPVLAGSVAGQVGARLVRMALWAN